MYKRLAVVALGLSVLASSAALSAYEGTRWGMSLNEVQERYGIDGFERDSAEGHTYLVVRNVARRTAVLAFFFKAGTFSTRAPFGGLSEVAVVFTRAGAAINKTMDDLPREDADGLAQTKRHVRELLEAKYGGATKVANDLVWKTADNTVVALKVRDGLATVVYEPKDRDFDLLLGL